MEFVWIQSQAGASCWLRNPFAGGAVLSRDGRKAETLSGELLQFATSKGEKLVLTAVSR